MLKNIYVYLKKFYLLNNPDFFNQGLHKNIKQHKFFPKLIIIIRTIIN